jgi:hypothetical protein
VNQFHECFSRHEFGKYQNGKAQPANEQREDWRSYPLGESDQGIGSAEDIVFDHSGGMWDSRNGEYLGKMWEW